MVGGEGSSEAWLLRVKGGVSPGPHAASFEAGGLSLRDTWILYSDLSTLVVVRMTDWPVLLAMLAKLISACGIAISDFLNLIHDVILRLGDVSAFS